MLMKMPLLSLVRNLFTGLVICLMLGSCQEQPPVKLGFTAALTGRAAGLGTAGRNGFTLAVEQMNAQGGLHGKPVEIIIRDNQMDSDTASKVALELTASGVSAIIGPMTSQMALAEVPISNQAGIPLIAPTVSTNLLAGQDDFFFRIYYSNAQAAELLASRLAATKAVSRMAVIYDIGNRAYTEDWLRIFRKHFEGMGGEIVTTLPFEMSQDTLFTTLANEVLSAGAEGVLILANALDTALICQQVFKQNASIARYATGWSYSDNLLVFGGQAVEGLTLLQSADLSSQNEPFLALKKEYEERFREPLNFPAVHAYDATRMALTALERATPGADLKQVLLDMDDFRGLQGPLAFDDFGDLHNPRIFLAQIFDGQFVRLK